MDPWQYFTTNIRYNDFQWHSVRIERNLTHFKMFLDGDLKEELATSSPTLESDLLLGGFPHSRVIESNSITERMAFKLYVGDFRSR